MDDLDFRASDLRYYSGPALRTLESNIKAAIRKETRTVHDRELVEKMNRRLKTVCNEKVRRHGVSPTHD